MTSSNKKWVVLYGVYSNSPVAQGRRRIGKVLAWAVQHHRDAAALRSIAFRNDGMRCSCCVRTFEEQSRVDIVDSIPLLHRPLRSRSTSVGAAGASWLTRGKAEMTGEREKDAWLYCCWPAGKGMLSNRPAAQQLISGREIRCSKNNGGCFQHSAGGPARGMRSNGGGGGREGWRWWRGKGRVASWLPGCLCTCIRR